VSGRDPDHDALRRLKDGLLDDLVSFGTQIFIICLHVLLHHTVYDPKTTLPIIIHNSVERQRKATGELAHIRKAGMYYELGFDLLF
jgi:hypothetical protein